MPALTLSRNASQIPKTTFCVLELFIVLDVHEPCLDFHFGDKQEGLIFTFGQLMRLPLLSNAINSTIMGAMKKISECIQVNSQKGQINYTYLNV